MLNLTDKVWLLLSFVLSPICGLTSRKVRINSLKRQEVLADNLFTDIMHGLSAALHMFFVPHMW